MWQLAGYTIIYLNLIRYRGFKVWLTWFTPNHHQVRHSNNLFKGKTTTIICYRMETRPRLRDFRGDILSVHFKEVYPSQTKRHGSIYWRNYFTKWICCGTTLHLWTHGMNCSQWKKRGHACFVVRHCQTMCRLIFTPFLPGMTFSILFRIDRCQDSITKTLKNPHCIIQPLAVCLYKSFPKHAMM